MNAKIHRVPTLSTVGAQARLAGRAGKPFAYKEH